MSLPHLLIYLRRLIIVLLNLTVFLSLITFSPFSLILLLFFIIILLVLLLLLHELLLHHLLLLSLLLLQLLLLLLLLLLLSSLVLGLLFFSLPCLHGVSLRIWFSRLFVPPVLLSLVTSFVLLLLLLHDVLHVLVIIVFLLVFIFISHVSAAVLLIALPCGKSLLREVDVAFYLHSLVIVHLTLVVDVLIEKILQLLFKDQSLVHREVLRVSLVFLVQMLEHLVLLILIKVFKGNVLLVLRLMAALEVSLPKRAPKFVLSLFRASSWVHVIR